MSSANQRRFPRANYPCSITVWQENNYDTILANTANIGAGGILVYLNQRLPVRAMVDIKIDFPKETSLQCQGRVLRCQESQESSTPTKKYYAIAIVFEGLDEGKVAHLKTLIDKLLKLESKD